jgi:hypothetical protein
MPTRHSIIKPRSVKLSLVHTYIPSKLFELPLTSFSSEVGYTPKLIKTKVVQL